MNYKTAKDGLNAEGVLNLVGAILKHGSEHPNYFKSPCGVYWAEVAGLDAEKLFRMAVKGTQREGEPYSALERCPECTRN